MWTAIDRLPSFTEVRKTRPRTNAQTTWINSMELHTNLPVCAEVRTGSLEQTEDRKD